MEAGLALEPSAGCSLVSIPGPIKEATGPVELLEPGRERDGVRLLVTSGDGTITHAAFTDFPELLGTGDVVVVNDSATIPAALPAQLGRKRLRLHISSAVPATSRRLVELRLVDGLGSVPYGSAKAGDIVRLPGAARAVLVSPRLRVGKPPRLWEADLMLPAGLHEYLASYGEPIRYGYVSRAWDLDAYQTIFARVAGSSEMTSAGRPFSARVVRKLQARGVSIVPVTLHTGVASLESDEQPYPEPFEISEATARAINEARSAGRRVIAVGTTVARALEGAIQKHGRLVPGSDETDIFISPGFAFGAVDAMITNFHLPQSTLLVLVSALAGRTRILAAYEEAIAASYRFFSFGDAMFVERA